MARSRSPKSERRGAAADLLVVGLGNPGARYEGTLHNVGVDVVSVLADRHDAKLRRSKQLADTAEVVIGDRRLALAVPHTFMNESGQAVRPLCTRHGIEDLDRLLIVHDELDLDPGRLKVKVGGGLAGHNGLKSIRSHLGSDGFARIRVGVGKPPSAGSGASHVLRRPPARVRDTLAVSVEEAADAVELYLDQGAAAAMNRYNQ